MVLLNQSNLLKNFQIKLLSGLFIFTREDSSEYKVKTDNKYLDKENKEGNNLFANLEFNVNDNSKLNLVMKTYHVRICCFSFS